MSWKLYISNQANNEIEEIWDYGYTNFGKKVADDYDSLILQALTDIKEDPFRSGTKIVRNISGKLYSYHIRYSRKNTHGNIKNPQHSIFYFTINREIIAIASISREIREQHINNIDSEIIKKEIKEIGENI